MSLDSMQLDAIQKDYGGFDPKFVGIRLRFKTRDAFRLYVEMCSLERQIPRVLEIGNAAIAGSAEAAFATFCIGTTQIHEMRHFHDALLSPFGSLLFRLRIRAAVHGLQVLSVLLDGRSVLPVPIGKWRRKTDRELAALEELWRQFLPGMPPQPFPGLSAEHQRLLAITEDAYAQIFRSVNRRATVPPGFPDKPAQIFEASGILAQLQHVWSVYGEAHAQLFLDRLLSERHATPYVTALRVLHELSSSLQQPMDARLMTMVIFWSLLTDADCDAWSACPLQRFYRLVNYLAKQGVPPTSTAAGVLLDEWSEVLGSAPIASAIQGAIRQNDKLLSKLVLLPSRHSFLMRSIVDVLRMRIAAQQHMLHRFLVAPDDYLSLDLYQESISEWVASPIMFDFEGPALLTAKGDTSHGLQISKAVEMDDGRWAVVRAVSQGQTQGANLVSPSTASSAHDLFTMVDFAFAEFWRDEPDFDIARQVHERDGRFAVEILS